MPEQIDGRPVPSTLEGAAVVARPYDVEELRRLIEGE
jgi:hypothetical protein